MITRIEYYIGFIVLVLGFVALAIFIDNFMPYITTEEIRTHYKISAEAIEKFKVDIQEREIYGAQNRKRICQIQLNMMMIAIRVGIREPIILDPDCNELLIKK